jgi:arylsulfatase A-like enzyme
MAAGGVRRSAAQGQPLLAAGFMHLAATGTLVYFFLRFSLRETVRPFSFSLQSAAEIAVSIAAVNLLVVVVNAAVEARVLRSMLQIALLFLLWIANTYYLTTHAAPDLGLILDNIGLAASRHSLGVIWTSFSLPHVAAGIAFCALVAVLEVRYRALSQATYRRRWPMLCSAVLLLGGLAVVPVQSYEPASAFLQDAYHRAFSDFSRQKLTERFPYLKDSVPISGAFAGAPGERPDIFLLMIESFNANFVEKKTPDGREITPVMNRLIGEGRYYDRFYGNSIQTSKGQTAVLLSVPPAIRGKVFTNYPDLKFKALPSYLAEAGYDTLFMQAAEDLTFENTDRFMKRTGFADVRTAFEFTTARERANKWGWGVEDAQLYRHFFEYLAVREAARPGKPVFALLATIANHTRFDEMPAARKLLYPRPRTVEENYANSIHLTDSQLDEFVASVKARKRPAVIIITGDHSFPMNEHGYTHNETGHFDESFRIPFLLIYPGAVAPHRIDGRAYSQVDIAPTILDLAGVHAGANSFTGRSLFLDDAEPRPVYLVQPYGGVYLQSVRYPWKYIYHRKTGSAYLYNLADDPGETLNRLPGAPPRLIETFKHDILAIKLNQRILDTNALYPGEPRAPVDAPPGWKDAAEHKRLAGSNIARP